MKILLASNNQHKADEIREIIKFLRPNVNIEIFIPSDLSEQKIIPDENGNSYYENAEIKASAFFEIFHIPTIADDSGLEIEFLNGQPGIYSSSFGGEEGNHKKNREKVRQLLEESDICKANALFRAVFCYIDNSQKFFVEGIVNGNIINEERGDGGFGYDSMFIPNGYEKTFAELDEEEKNRISHRFEAVENLLIELEKRSIIK